MANYGRGWDDGYGGQSAEAIDAYQDRQEIEAGQIQNAAANRRREIAACKSTAFDAETECCLSCGHRQSCSGSLHLAQVLMASFLCGGSSP